MDNKHFAAHPSTALYCLACSASSTHKEHGNQNSLAHQHTNWEVLTVWGASHKITRYINFCVDNIFSIWTVILSPGSQGTSRSYKRKSHTAERSGSDYSKLTSGMGWNWWHHHLEWMTPPSTLNLFPPEKGWGHSEDHTFISPVLLTLYNQHCWETAAVVNLTL